jgi:single-stranded-DNA-specific exonuclease
LHFKKTRQRISSRKRFTQKRTTKNNEILIISRYSYFQMSGSDSSSPTPCVLSVTDSLSARRWQWRCSLVQEAEALRITQHHGVDERLARVLAGRGVISEDLPAFLDPKLRDCLPDPSTFTDMEKAAARLAHAVLHNERVAIFGDYDVDGACSAALLSEGLQRVGVTDVRIHIPDRVAEGYGPNIPAIQALHKAGAQLLVTVDCGTSGHAPLSEAKRLGMDVVVLDHHQAPETLPDVCALVNPNRLDDVSGQGHLCAAGVVFVTLVALYRHVRDVQKRAPLPDLLDLLDLVALATIADVVPLKGLNRAFVRQGMRLIRARSRAGIRALMDIAGLKEPAQPWHLGFMIAPRINAGGRIGEAGLGAKLLLTNDDEEAQSIAVELDHLNRERQVIEQVAMIQAEEQVLEHLHSRPECALLVLADKRWHPGVLGLIASRMKEKYARPVFAIGFDEQEGGHGSGRSIAGVDLGKVVRAAVDKGILSAGGGHAMAAGITLPSHGREAFRAYMVSQIKSDVEIARQNTALKIDSSSAISGLTPELVMELEKAGPFGSEMPEPIFALSDVRIQDVRIVGQNHVRLRLQSPDRASLNGILFRAVDTPLGDALLKAMGKNIHVAGTLSMENWGSGAPRVQMRIIDAAFSHR